jgi:hypothetical protein
MIASGRIHHRFVALEDRERGVAAARSTALSSG